MSEFDLIRRLIAEAPIARGDVVVGPGDDSAVLAVPDGHELVLTTDTLVAGRHFPRDTAAADIGWKGVATNLSDLAAMGAEPRWVTAAVTVPESDEAWLSGFVSGMAELLAETGTALVGGDLTRGPLTITIQAAGVLPAGTALRRNGARPGDVVAVTGSLGDAALALARWSWADESASDRALRQRLTRPHPCLEAGRILRGRASAAIDISDGLLADLEHIAEASGVGAVVEAKRLPCSSAFESRCPAGERLKYQLAGGDDYELCVCGPEAAIASMSGLTVIGRIETDPGVRVVDADGSLIVTSDMGYDHFRD